MKIALLAGELSGDLLASELAVNIKNIFPDVELIGIVGEKMLQQGVKPLFKDAHINQLSVIGLTEVLPKLPQILYFRAKVIKQLILAKPDFIVGVDAPDFNLTVLKTLRAKGFTTFQMVAPTLWAWRSWRIRKLRKAVDKLLCIFPFEEQWFNSRNMPAVYIGHPLANKIEVIPDLAKLREEMKIDINKTIIALLPGSRKSEIIRHSKLIAQSAQLIYKKLSPENGVTENFDPNLTLDSMRFQRVGQFRKVVGVGEINESALEVFNHSPIQFLVPLPTVETYNLFAELCHLELPTLPIRLMRGHSQRAMAVADFCVVASGTASLEVALYKKPMAIFYKLSAATYQIMKQLYKLTWLGLPNILCGKMVVGEFIQKSATPENLANECIRVLGNQEIKAQIKTEFIEMHKKLIISREEILKDIFIKKTAV